MKKKKRNNWPLIVTILAFTISLLFSFMSESVMPKVGIIVGIMILILFIFIGIIFDMIGVAVTFSNEEPLHAMSSKKIKGAKKAVSFKNNADKYEYLIVHNPQDKWIKEFKQTKEYRLLYE